MFLIVVSDHYYYDADVTPAGMRALVAVVERGSFRAAADSLGYSQSSISQQVRLLEREVGGALFERTAGPVPAALTSLGQIVLEQSQRILDQVRSAEQAVRDHLLGKERIVIGTFQAVTNTVLPQLVTELLTADPDLGIELVETESARPELDRSDFCFFDGPPAPGDHGRVILNDDHVLLAPAGRLARGPVGAEALADLPMVALPRVCDQAAVEDALAAHGLRPPVVFRTADNAALLAMVAAGLGCAILPQLSAMQSHGLDRHRLDVSIPPRSIYLQWRRPPSPAALRAIDVAEAVAAETTRLHLEGRSD